MQPAIYVQTSELGQGKRSTELQGYLESIGWKNTTFTNTQLETMIAASCLRFLGGLTDISFVLGFSQAIYMRYKSSLKLPLWYCTEILGNLSEKLRNKTILVNETDTIKAYINDAQEVITTRRYNYV